LIAVNKNENPANQLPIESSNISKEIRSEKKASEPTVTFDETTITSTNSVEPNVAPAKGKQSSKRCEIM